MSPALPSEDAVRRRAHEIWLARGMGHGNALDDWLTAERELAVPPLPVPLAPVTPAVVPTVPAAVAAPKVKAKKPGGKGKGAGKGKGRAR